jgi:hypothetical protein
LRKAGGENFAGLVKVRAVAMLRRRPRTRAGSPASFRPASPSKAQESSSECNQELTAANHSNDSDEGNAMLQVEKADRRNHWAVILAGGDGTRLKSLTRKISGDERPKQFCPVLGDVSLLEETRRRIAHEFATAQTLYVVNRRHAEYYQPLLRNVTADNLVAQPANRGTAPAILYSLLRIAVRDPNAVVTFFPSDHYISNDRMFMRHVRCASDAARRRADLIVLLGIEPETPEVEYGWIEPSVGIPGQGKVFGVRRFWEKPNEVLAQVLQLRGCLWNSFVMTASEGVARLYRALGSGAVSLIFVCVTCPRNRSRMPHDGIRVSTPTGSKFLSASAGAPSRAARGHSRDRRSLERSGRAETRARFPRYGRRPSTLGRRHGSSIRIADGIVTHSCPK